MIKHPVPSIIWPALLVACALLASRAPAAQTSAAPDRLTAEFTMVRTLSVLSDSISSSGRLVLGGPGRMRFEMTAPSRSILVIDGGKGWIRYPDLDVTKSFDLGADPVMRVLSEHLLVLTSGDFAKAGAYYAVTDGAKPGEKRLVPKQPEIRALFSEIRVAMGPNGVVSWVELVSAGGDTTRLAFKNVKINPPIDASLFEKP
jgi:outer membrane lipoprotein carrier protein